jgi:hypothetical protein
VVVVVLLLQEHCQSWVCQAQGDQISQRLDQKRKEPHRCFLLDALLNLFACCLDDSCRRRCCRCCRRCCHRLHSANVSFGRRLQAADLGCLLLGPLGHVEGNAVGHVASQISAGGLHLCRWRKQLNHLC